MTTETRSTSELVERYMGYGATHETAYFRNMVDLLVAHMIQDKIPPDVMRDAAYLAGIKFMQMYPCDVMYVRDDLPARPLT